MDNNTHPLVRAVQWAREDVKNAHHFERVGNLGWQAVTSFSSSGRDYGDFGHAVAEVDMSMKLSLLQRMARSSSGPRWMRKFEMSFVKQQLINGAHGWRRMPSR